jgi:hypothetical protein
VAANNKAKGQLFRDHLTGTLVQHMEASARRVELLQEARELQAAGKTSEARQRLNLAEDLQQRLTDLERHFGGDQS